MRGLGAHIPRLLLPSTHSVESTDSVSTTVFGGENAGLLVMRHLFQSLIHPCDSSSLSTTVGSKYCQTSPTYAKGLSLYSWVIATLALWNLVPRQQLPGYRRAYKSSSILHGPGSLNTVTLYSLNLSRGQVCQNEAFLSLLPRTGQCRSLQGNWQ